MSAAGILESIADPVVAFDTAAQGVRVVDTAGRTESANERMAELLKYASASELLGRSAFDFVPEEDRSSKAKAGSNWR